MKALLIGVFLLLVFSPAQAELISPRPYCADIRNDTDHYLFASVRTDFGKNAAGEKKRHESSFRLEAGQTQRACATGPFYPGYQVELVIKAMIPVFTCKTVLQGTIAISTKRDEKGINRYAASCVPPARFP
jgi:hypothetical protein